MNQGRICISVFDTRSNRYLRPIPPSGRFTEQDVRHLGLFSIVNLDEDNRDHQFQAPHTEDFSVTNNQLQPVGMLNREEQLALLRRISVQSTFDIFGYNYQDPALKQHRLKYYVLPGTGQNSLGTVQAINVRLYMNAFGNIRVDFTDFNGNTLRDIPFVSYNAINPEVLNLQLQRCREKFVRLSLARPFQPDNWEFRACFLQVSGIHGY